MTNLESGEKTRPHLPTDENIREAERPPLKVKEVGESEDLDVRWARLAERVRKREEVEERLKRVGERFERKERERREARERAERQAESVTEKAETTDATRGEVQEKPGIRSKGDLDRAIEHHPEARLRLNFERDYGNAVERVERGRKGRDEGEALINELERMELYRLYTEAHGGPPDAHIDSMENVRNALQKYPDVKMTEAQANLSEKYFIVMHDDSRIHAELSKDLDVSMGQVANWKTGESPQPIGELRKREADRIVDEWVKATDFQKIAEHEPTKMRLEQRFDSGREIPDSVVREAIPVETKRPWTMDDLADLTRRVYENRPESTARFHYADLRKSAGLSVGELADLERAVSADHSGFEKMVQDKLRLDGVESNVRAAMVDGRLMTWNPDRNPRDLINPYGSLFFYFRDRDALARFISEVKGKIEGDAGGGLHGTVEYLERLIAQMFPEGREGPSVNNASARMQGDHLHLMLDMLGTTIKSLEGDISRLTKGGGRGGIDNPRFPEGKTFEVLVNRLMSTVTSDCHLRPTGTVEYFEDKRERIRIVTKYLQAFGDIDLKPQWVAHEHHYHAYMRAPLGKMLHYLGITATNKCVENQGLPPLVFEFCWEARCAYIEDLIPQDGSVSRSSISWCHSNALVAGSMSEKYKMGPKIEADLVEFIKKQGDKSDKGKTIRRGTWVDLKDSKDPAIAEKAIRLEKCIAENRNRLIDDEKRIAETLGIDVKVVASSVNWQERTGRVSISWTATPKDIFEAIKLGMIAPPNDVTKRGIVKEMLRRKNEDVEKALKFYEDRGVHIEQWWNKGVRRT